MNVQVPFPVERVVEKALLLLQVLILSLSHRNTHNFPQLRSTFVAPQMSMPAPSVPNYPTAPPEPSSAFVQPQMSMPAVVIPNIEEGARRTNEMYGRGRDSPHSSDDSDDFGTPRRSRQPLRRTSSGSVPDITVEPPVRLPSLIQGCFFRTNWSCMTVPI
jgi:hypothetical protein